jgi:hypothetical protein
MTGEDDEDSYEVLTQQSMRREGLTVKLDRGFEEGTYCVYVLINALAARVGFAAAHRRAVEYCASLKAQFDVLAAYSAGETEDASRTGGRRWRRDPNLAYFCFPIVMADGCFHDAAMKEQFRVAVLRTGQQGDQLQARAETHRRDTRRNAFRAKLDTLLAGDAYRHVDGATKERLLEEVSALVFPPRGIEP